MTAIAAGTRSAETRSKAPSEGCQSGGAKAAHRPILKALAAIPLIIISTILITELPVIVAIAKERLK